MYQVLARKYRPKNFHELLGQDHVAKALSNAITQQRLHHAYLFTGTRGVGKTTIARILAKCLNCETGVTNEPCGVCTTCVAIDAGRFIDLIEIDAASRTKVEDTRELLDNVPYAPTQGRYKVYLIDEVHMLSTHSFNALLKTLEEPPEHVKFLLATTDPQKLPITIISRCLQFVLRPLPQPQLAEYLGTILQREHIVFAPDALWQLASSAKGSVRDALSLTDQAIAFGNGQITTTTLQQMLGLLDQADVIGLLFAIHQRQLPALQQGIMQLRAQVVDAKAVFDSLAELLHQVALLQLLPNFDLQLNRQQAEKITQLAQLLPPDLVQLYYEIVIHSRDRIALANTPLQALEMCLLRLLAFRPLGTQQVVANNQPEIAPQLIKTPPTETSVNVCQKTDTATLNADPTENHTDVTDNELPKPSSSEQLGDDVTLVEPESHQVEHTQKPLPSIQSNNLPPATPKKALEKISAETPSDQQQNTAAILGLTPSPPEQPAELPVTQLPNTEPTVTTVTTVTTVPKASISQVTLNQPKPNGALPEMTVDEAANNLSPVVSSPLDLLKPAPQTLTGEWTPDKWDYWVHQARENNWLTEDELVVAKRGLMVGEIAGIAQFVTEGKVLSHSVVFEHLCQTLKKQLNSVTITLSHPENIQQISNNFPEARQQQRENLATSTALAQFQALPVIQRLVKKNAAVDSVKLTK